MILPIVYRFWDAVARSGDNAAIDLETGELHIISSWNDDEDD